jgi:hypothetical protein
MLGYLSEEQINNLDDMMTWMDKMLTGLIRSQKSLNPSHLTTYGEYDGKAQASDSR